MTWGGVAATPQTVGAHHYTVYEPTQLSVWLDAVADEYVKLRTECVTPIQPIDLAGIGIVSTDAIKRRIAQATVPRPDISRGAFSVTRADLSEVAAYMVLERDFNTAIGYKLVRDRELVQLPGRGIDAIGVESDAKLMVVLAEVKFSDEDSSPSAPQVVDKAKDAMRKQHLGHMSELENTINKIWECGRQSRDQKLQSLYFSAALYLENGLYDKVGLVACCVLVRPKSKHSPGDFGSFAKSPDDFAPGNVRFIIFCLPNTIDEVLKSWKEAIEVRSKVE